MTKKTIQKWAEEYYKNENPHCFCCEDEAVEKFAKWCDKKLKSTKK